MGKTRFGILLKRYRQSAGLSQEALAERAGLSARAISDLERGVNRSPRIATLELIIDALPLSSQQADLLKIAAHPDQSFLPGKEAPARLSGIPLPPARLIGREVERSQARELLREGKTRLLTLTGPSGVGKTRLAVELARDLEPDFAGGVVYVSLATVRDALLVPGILAQALRVQESPTLTLQEQVIATLQNGHFLLVLDNLEQIVDCSPFIARLLEYCPRLVILATSRAPLRLRAEQEFLLAPLALEDAVTLFTERAHSMRAGMTLSRQEVAPICQQLDCLPLAIELAAMQGRLFSLAELSVRLAHSFRLLRAGARDLPARQQTMEHAIAWSYELLPAEQQRCFRFLGVFEAGWTLEAAEAVCWSEDDADPPEERLLTLAGLVEFSLVQTEAVRGAVRFSMLRLIREFALERLNAAGEVELARYRHAHYFADLAEKARAMFESAPLDPDLPLARELYNVRAALVWAETHHAAGLGLQLCGFARLWHVLGQPSQAERWFERMLALDQDQREAGLSPVPLTLRVEALNGLARVQLGRGLNEPASAKTREALSLAQEISDPRGLTNAWANLGMIAKADSRLDDAEKAFNQSILYAAKTKDEALRYRSLVFLAEIARERGDLDHAGTILEEALASAQVLQAEWDIAMITTLLAHLARQQHDLRSAKSRYRDSLRRLSTFGSPTYIAWCIEGCAAVLYEDGRTGPAVRLLAAAENLRKLAGTPLPRNERLALETLSEKASEDLGPEVFHRERMIGSALTQEGAIELAFMELE